MRIFIFLILFSCSSYGNILPMQSQGMEQEACETQEEKDCSPQPIIIENLEGVVLVGDVKDIQNIPSPISGLKLRNIVLPGPKNELQKEIEALYLNKPLTKKIIAEIKKTILCFYQKYDHPVVMILVPEQDISNGVLQLVVKEAVIGKVIVKNNKYLKTNTILRNFSLHAGDNINADMLQSHVALINRNPFQNATVVLNPGEGEGKTDIELIVEDRFPIMAFSGIDNSGTNYIHENRFFGGFYLGNLFQGNNFLTYQYTSSWDFHTFWGHTANMSFYLPTLHTLTLIGSFSKAHPTLPGVTSDGRSSQASFRYAIPINRIYRNLQHTVNFGIDYKSTNNNVTQSEVVNPTVISSTADILQGILEYDLAYKGKKTNIYWRNELIFSPAQILSGQKQSNYDQLSFGSKPKYVYFRTSFDQKQYLPKDFAIHLEFVGQVSSNKLLPSERYSLGGMDTVRGYRNRFVNLDDILLTSIEMITPSFHLFKHKKNVLNDRFEMLAFIDFATGMDANSSRGHTMLGTGLGMRYFLGTYIDVRFDWGIPLLKVLGERSQKVYVQAIIRF